jgi:hypothetical protein
MNKLFKILFSIVLIFALVYILMIVGPGFRYILGGSINEIVGLWEGSIQVDERVIPIEVEIQKSSGEEDGTMIITNKNTSASNIIKVDYENITLVNINGEISLSLRFQKGERGEKTLSGKIWDLPLENQNITGEIYITQSR